MRTSRRTAALGCGLLGGLILLGATGCGVAEPENPSRATLDVVEVTTLTTVQSSSGSFLSPSPRRDIPPFLLSGAASPPADAGDESDRAKVDLAVLFRDAEVGAPPELDAQLARARPGEWSPLQHYFPDVLATGDGFRWPLGLARREASDIDEVSTEWSGWQSFGGLGVRQPGSDAGASAAVATLELEVSGTPSPLVLSMNGADELVVTNQSGRAIGRALLVYSHSGGVAVTSLNELGPGASRITTLGPKEQPPERLLEIAREVLGDFFAESVGAELGAAMAGAKSIPFLETHGFRLISLLDEGQAPAEIDYSRPLASRKRVVVSHSEILKVEEEARLMTVVADEALDVGQVTSELGRFSEGKLELAEKRGDAGVSARAQSLLNELRSR